MQLGGSKAIFKTLFTAANFLLLVIRQISLQLMTIEFYFGVYMAEISYLPKN